MVDESCTRGLVGRVVPKYERVITQHGANWVYKSEI
jgi:hypothetical protein